MAINFTPSFQPYTGQGSFMFWAQKVLPLVYDDSLSYYEVLCKVVNFLNNVIKDMDAVESNTQALLDAYNQLQEYVNNYFDNLDVQEEINHKLDAMAESGELSELLAPFIPDIITGWLTEHVDPVGSAVIVDDTLSIAGAAADAKATGDAIADVKNKSLIRLTTTERDNLASAMDLDPDTAFPFGCSFSGTGSVVNRIFPSLTITLTASGVYQVISFRDTSEVNSTRGSVYIYRMTTGTENYYGYRQSDSSGGNWTWKDVSYSVIETAISDMENAIDNAEDDIDGIEDSLEEIDTSITDIFNRALIRLTATERDDLASAMDLDPNTAFPFGRSFSGTGSVVNRIFPSLNITLESDGNYQVITFRDTSDYHSTRGSVYIYRMTTGTESYYGYKQSDVSGGNWTWKEIGYDELVHDVEELQTTVSNNSTNIEDIYGKALIRLSVPERDELADAMDLNPDTPFPFGHTFSGPGSIVARIFPTLNIALDDSGVYQVISYRDSSDLHASRGSVFIYRMTTGEERIYGYRQSDTSGGNWTWKDMSKDSLGNLFTEFNASAFKWTIPAFLGNTGNTSNLATYATTDYFEVTPGQEIINPMPQLGEPYAEYRVYVNFYNSVGTVILRISREVMAVEGFRCVVPDNAVSARFCYGYASDSGITMTAEILRANFRIQISKHAKAQTDMLASDDCYVAFGASTTVGAVHHYTGTGLTYSLYTYPEYVGEKIGLKTYNLAIGTTGLMARGSDGSRNSILDQIYTHDTELQKAKLITLLVSYGNDWSEVHYTDNGVEKTGLPIGDKTDYYPYDESGYHPSGSEGINTMINKGATWFGCLNWAIKWLSQHYPKAQIVLMFGVMSANTGLGATTSRAITVQDNGSESIGTPKYSLVFSEPTSTVYLNIETHLKELVNLYNIDLIDMFEDGLPYTYWAARTQNNDGTYALFSTTGTAQNPVMNNHPNDDGYMLITRYIAGKIISLYYR